MSYYESVYQNIYSLDLRKVNVFYLTVEAIKRDHMSVVRYLYNSSPNSSLVHKHVLSYMIENDDMHLSKFLSEINPDVLDITDECIELASRCGKLDIVKKLHEYSLGVNRKSNRSVIIAASQGNCEIVEYLCDNGYEVHLENDAALEYDDALDMAAINGHLNVVMFLHEYGININGMYHQPLISACAHGHFHIVKYLIENGADYKICIQRCLYIAVINHHFNISEYLIELGADVNYSNGELLRDLCGRGNLIGVKYMIGNGADIYCRGNNIIPAGIVSALDCAAFNGHEVIVKYLCEHNANINNYGDIALNYAIYSNHLNIVKYLVKNNANVNGYNNLALEYTFKASCKSQILKYLIENGADTQYLRDDTILKVIETGDLSTVELLHQKNVDVFKNCDESLGMALAFQKFDIAQFFINNGANLESVCVSNLISAIKCLNLAVVKFIFDRGIDINIGDNIAIRTAVEFKRVEIIKYLLENGSDIPTDTKNMIRASSILSMCCDKYL